MSKKKIVFPFIGSGIGGSYISAYQIISSLVHDAEFTPEIVLARKGKNFELFQNTGAEITVFDLQKHKKAQNKTPWYVPDVLYQFIFYVKLIIKANRYVKEVKPQLVHANGDKTLLVWGIAAKLNKIPVIWHVRQEKGKRLLDFFRLRLASCIIFVSDANKVRFVNFKRIPEHTTIYNGVILDSLFPVYEKKIQKTFQKAHAPIHIGFVGLLSKRKRPEWFVQAGLFCLRNGVHAKFFFAGADEDHEYAIALNQTIKQEEACDRFIYLGFRADMAAVYEQLDILVLPSEIGGEAFPRVVIEAMASGVVVVASEVAGIPEAITHNVDGILFDPENIEDLNEKLLAAAKDKDQQNFLRTNAYETVKKRFSNTITNKEIRNAYKTLI